MIIIITDNPFTLIFSVQRKKILSLSPLASNYRNNSMYSDFEILTSVEFCREIVTPIRTDTVLFKF